MSKPGAYPKLDGNGAWWRDPQDAGRGIGRWSVAVAAGIGSGANRSTAVRYPAAAHGSGILRTAICLFTLVHSSG
jgi:hypothetical protein